MAKRRRGVAVTAKPFGLADLKAMTVKQLRERVVASEAMAEFREHAAVENHPEACECEHDYGYLWSPYSMAGEVFALATIEVKNCEMLDAQDFGYTQGDVGELAGLYEAGKAVSPPMVEMRADSDVLTGYNFRAALMISAAKQAGLKSVTAWVTMVGPHGAPEWSASRLSWI